MPAERMAATTPAPPPENGAPRPYFGFVIDNRRCIGCHACTVACKAEHSDPIGVNKTWVQYIEKGIFPHTTRAFHVLRCNHCADAPCVEICPTASLATRRDGIVDFDPGRCIGCKACMQACPYDAIALLPEEKTATKCNYCAHRVDAGREPACVVVCPVEAIVAGDLNDPASRIARLVATQPAIVRKPEKGTRPKLYYIDGDADALDPSKSARSTMTMWGSRPRDAVDDAPATGRKERARGAPRRTYDIPQRHAASWGWKVSAYLFTKSIAAGAFLAAFSASLSLGSAGAARLVEMAAWIALVALGATGILLVADLGRPERFHWVLLRPQWRSWLVRGAYVISVYGALLAAILLWPAGASAAGGTLVALAALFAALTAAYSGWLFAQAKGRDLWQSPLSPLHLLVQAFAAGSAALLPFATTGTRSLLEQILFWSLAANVALVFLEIFGRHSTSDARRAARIARSGATSAVFWLGVVAIGHLLPALFLLADAPELAGLVAIWALVGLYSYEYLWVDAPQRIALA